MPVRLAWVAIVFCVVVPWSQAQVSFRPVSKRHSTIDMRAPRKDERIWEILISGRKIGATLLTPNQLKPEILRQFKNHVGNVLFTLSTGFSDIAWSDNLLTFFYRGGKLHRVSDTWQAAGLDDDGGVLLQKDEGTYMSPIEAPYDHVSRMQIKSKGKIYDLGIVSKAQLHAEGHVTGYWFEDAQGKRGNGYSGTWFKQWFRWKGGHLVKLGRLKEIRNP